MHKKTLILGMGNTLLGDDGIGILIAEELENHLVNKKFIDVKYTSWGGFRILDIVAGYEKLIVVDAVKTNQKPPGSVHILDYKELINSVRMISFHDINFAAAIELGKVNGLKMPDEISVYAIEVLETNYVTEEINDVVLESIPLCKELILNEIEKTKYIEALN